MKNYKKQEQWEIFDDMDRNKKATDRHSEILWANKEMKYLKEYFDNGEMTLDQFLQKKANICEQAINNSK